MPRDLPDGLDAPTSQRVVRTFLLVRIVRGVVLLLFLVVALVGVELRGWPPAVALVIGLVSVVQVVALGVWCGQYRTAGGGFARRGR